MSEFFRAARDMSRAGGSAMTEQGSSGYGLVYLVILLFVPSPAGAESASTDSPLVLAHMMPWYTVETDDSGDRSYGWHWTMNHFDPNKVVDGQPELASHFRPLIGPYDSGDPHVIEYQLLTMKITGIDGVIVDWYGLTNFRDYPRLNRNTTRLLQGCERLGMKFVICYEDQTVPALVEAGKLEEANRIDHVVDEIAWLGKYWFKSPAYVRQDGEPVLLSFGFAGLKNDEWAEVIERSETPIRYFSQNIRRDGAVGGFDWPSPKNGIASVDKFLKRAGEWSQAIPVVYPRFVDIYEQAGLHEGYGTIEDRNGRTFRATFSKAMNADKSIVQIATWNDWGEGTQIEPSVEYGYRDLETLQSKLNPNGKPSQLRLPDRVLQLRRKTAGENIDGVVELLQTGELEKASIRLNRLEGAAATGDR